MDNLALITIIVPVYNVELYFDRCIKSILGQTYTNLQIILIDDGSTDKSGELCDKYATIDERIEVFHQEHQGASSARNVGLKNCKGDYIGFVDSDDWCEPEMFMSMVNTMNENEADLVRCNYRFIFDDRTEVFISNSETVVLTGRDAVIDMYHHTQKRGYGTSIWNTLFKADIIKTPNMIFFDTNLEYGEDADVLRQLLLRCKSVVCDSGCYYNYNRQNLMSVMNELNYEMLIKNIEKKIFFLQKNEFPKSEISSSQTVRMKYILYSGIEQYISTGNEVEFGKISYNECLIINNKNVLSSVKLYFMITLIRLKVSSKIVRAVWNIHR